MKLYQILQVIYPISSAGQTGKLFSCVQRIRIVCYLHPVCSFKNTAAAEYAGRNCQAAVLMNKKNGRYRNRPGLIE
jgi:hypothetical protein